MTRSGSISAADVLAMARSITPAAAAPTFRVVPSWITHQEKHWITLRPGRCPAKGKRKGTRRQWGRANPRGIRLRWVTVYDEPDHAIRTADGTVYCTARQYAAIKVRVPSSGERPIGFDGAAGYRRSSNG